MSKANEKSAVYVVIYAGSYLWNGVTSVFEKEKTVSEISILTHPENVSITEGKINGSISVDAVTNKGQQVFYQWYLRTGEGVGDSSGQLIVGATDQLYSLPLSLKKGIYRKIFWLGKAKAYLNHWIFAQEMKLHSYSISI